MHRDPHKHLLRQFQNFTLMIADQIAFDQQFQTAGVEQLVAVVVDRLFQPV